MAVVDPSSREADMWWLSWAVPLAAFITTLACLYGVACWGFRRLADGVFEPDELDTIDD